MDINQRFEKLDGKVDQINDQLGELRTDFKVHVALIEEHVAGDKKIITEIQPMLEAFKYEKLKRLERDEKHEQLYRYIKIFSGIFALVVAFYQIVSYVQK